MLRAFRLGHQSLWIDEVFTWTSAAIGRSLGLRDLLENVHGPLYSALVHAWAALAGDHEWTLRFPSAVCGVLTVPAMGWLALRWLGRETVIPALWLTAASPFLVWYSQEARNYSMLVLFVALSGAALLELRERVSVGGLARYAVAAAAGLLSNLSFALLAPLHLAWWLDAPAAARGRRWLALAAAAVLLLLVALPWVPQMARTWDWKRLHPAREEVAGETPLRGATTFHAAAVPFALHAFAVGYTLGPSLRELKLDPPQAVKRHLPELALTALVFGALGIRGLVAVARRRRLADTLWWILVPAAVVSYFAMQNFKVFHPRYLAVSAPCVVLVLAAAFADLGRRARWGLGAAVAALWSVSLFHHYFDPAYAREDYRGALAPVLQAGVAGEQVLAAGSEEPVFYYYRGPLRIERFWLGFAADPARLDAKMSEALARAPGTWVVLSRAEDLDPEDHFARALGRRFPEVRPQLYNGVRVWHLQSTTDTAPSAAGAHP